jgi:hypothetical protein
MVQAQFDYTTNNDAIAITRYTGSGGAVTVPNSTNGYPVTSIGRAFIGTEVTSVTIADSVTDIGSDAFAYCHSLTYVAIGRSVTNIAWAFFDCPSLSVITVDAFNTSYSTVDGVLFNKNQTTLAQYPTGKAGNYTVPNGVVTVGASAFEDCYTLTSVAIPDSVTSIEDNAFDMIGMFGHTSLTNVTMGNSVTNIGDSAFSGCLLLTNISIPNNVTRIGDGAFEGLTTVTIPASVTHLGLRAFGGGNLSEIVVDPLNPSYSSVDGVLFNKSQTTLIECPGAKGGGYTVPSSVRAIGDNAFAYCTGLTNVTIPDTVTFIGVSAFSGCAGLTTMTIPSGVTEIRNSAFEACTGLTNVTILGSVTSIGDFAFDGCASLSNVIIPNNVTSIGTFTFQGCDSLRGITIPESVIRIGYGAFIGCTNLTAIIVDAPNPAYSSVDGVLLNKSQTMVIAFPVGKTGSYAVPANVTNIGEAAFQGSRLTSVTMPTTVTSIGQGAFQGSSLTNITIPSSVAKIGDWAFGFCWSLAGVYFSGNAPSLGGVNVLYDNAVVYYVQGTTGWGDTFAGRPTALWNPQILLTDATFGLRSNQFGFTTSGPSNLVVVIEAATNLLNTAWLPVTTNALTGGSAYFSDPGWTNCPARFYRVRSL